MRNRFKVGTRKVYTSFGTVLKTFGDFFHCFARVHLNFSVFRSAIRLIQIKFTFAFFISSRLSAKYFEISSHILSPRFRRASSEMRRFFSAKRRKIIRMGKCNTH